MSKKEAIKYLRKLTFHKLVNMIKLWLSFYYSKLISKPAIWGMPTSLTIEPTTACNLGCPECPSGLKIFSRPTGSIKQTTLETTLRDLDKYLTYINFYFQGEPYIHKDFLNLVKLASEKGIFTSTSTNGHFLSEDNARKTVESGLDKLIISLDGTTQETYESYRINGRLDKVLEGTRNIIKAKKELNSKSPLVVFQFLVVKPNEHQIDDANSLAEKEGVDFITFKTAQLYDFKNGNELMPTKTEYSRYRKKKDGTYEIKNKLENQCWRMWRGSVVTWDGKIVPCCFDKDATHAMGNVNELSFKEVWLGNQYNAFRKGVLKGRSTIEICQNCSEGTKVWG
jgi:radical SAM protein with 4Fe4S-binding SPASM domain